MWQRNIFHFILISYFFHAFPLQHCAGVGSADQNAGGGGKTAELLLGTALFVWPTFNGFAIFSLASAGLGHTPDEGKA